MTMKGTKEQRVVSDGYSARLDLTASVVEQMGLHAAQPGVPRFSSVVPVLRAAGAGGEHLELLCSHVWVMWGFFFPDRLYLLNCFLHRLVSCEALLLFRLG